MSFQQYKNLNQGKSLHAESGHYGSGYLPGHQLVTLADGSHQPLRNMQPGDQVITIHPETGLASTTQVQEVTVSAAKNYALTRLEVVAVREQASHAATLAHLTSQVLEATPNHPLQAQAGPKPAGEVEIGEQLLCFNAQAQAYEPSTGLRRQEHAGGEQPVYNLVAGQGSTFVLNGVLVLQKQGASPGSGPKRTGCLNRGNPFFLKF